MRSIEVRRGFLTGVDGCGDGGRFRKHDRRTKWRRHHVQVVHDDFNGAVLVGPLPLVMSEDEDDEAIMTIVESLPVGGDNVGRKDVSILAELGDKGWRRAIVRVGANVEIGFVPAAHTRTRSVVYVTRMFEMGVVRFECE